MSEFFKRGKCRWCKTASEYVYRDTHLCERCDTDTVFCSVCKRRQSSESRCRHVFQDNDFKWCGAGVGPHPTDSVRAALFAMLDLMPAGFATDLAGAIKSGRFYTWIIAPMIGGGGILELNGMPDRDGRHMVTEWGDKMIALGEGNAAEDAADAYHWLASLYQRKTVRANKVTLTLLAEWKISRDMSTDCVACW